MRHHSVRGAGGVGLHVVESGNPAGRPLLFVHGWSQSHASWARQLQSSVLGERFRCVAFDLRGHGDSEKPAGAYADSELWAGDVRAILESLELERTILCGWSYGGYVINDYLRHCGPARLSALVYVSAATDAGGRLDYRFVGEGWNGVLPAPGSAAASAFSEGAEQAAAAMRLFVRNCFARSPGLPAELTMLGITLSTPPRVRRELFARKLRNDDVLDAVRLPALVVHGELDAIVDVETGKHIASRVAGSALSLYAGVGHLPFWEESERFEGELARFAGRLP